MENGTVAMLASLSLFLSAFIFPLSHAHNSQCSIYLLVNHSNKNKKNKKKNYPCSMATSIGMENGLFS